MKIQKGILMQKSLILERRTHKKIRFLILYSLKYEKKSIHEISIKAGVNWRTTELHLTFLKGKEYVSEVFRHHQLRIFEITKLGLKQLKKEDGKE